MLKNSIIENVLTTALEQCADFGEIYVEQTQKNTITMTNGAVDTALSGIDKGAGIRLFYGNQAVYAYTNDLSEKNLVEITKKASLAMKSNHTTKAVFDFTKPFQTNYNKIQKMPDTIPKKQKIEVMKGASSAAFLYPSPEHAPDRKRYRPADAVAGQRAWLLAEPAHQRAAHHP